MQVDDNKTMLGCSSASARGMTLGLMQPYLFPYIGYYQLAAAVDHFIFYDDVTFIKKGYINRNAILVEGQAARITLPIKNVSQNRLINEHLATEDIKTLLRTIEQSYRKAPYFSVVMPLIERVIGSQDRNIAHIAASSIALVFDYLGIKKNFSFSSTMVHDRSNKSEDRVLAICHEMRVIRYINSAGGMDLYREHHFTQNGVELRFLKSLPISYKQFDADFVPYLSMIDVLMFNDRDATIALLKQYEIVRGR